MALMSDTYRFLYLVNPKTASTSMRSYLQKHVRDSVYLQEQVSQLGCNVGYKYHPHHNRAEIVQSLCATLGKPYDEYFSFVMIRNPWSKMVSRYLYDRPDKGLLRFYDPGYDATTAFHHPFDDWLAAVKPGGYQIDKFAFDKQGRQLVTKIYPMETFSLPLLSQDINAFNANTRRPRLTVAKQLPFTNTTKHRHYSTYYSAESVEIVRRMYPKDIEIGCYEFELAENR